MLRLQATVPGLKRDHLESSLPCASAGGCSLSSGRNLKNSYLILAEGGRGDTREHEVRTPLGGNKKFHPLFSMQATRGSEVRHEIDLRGSAILLPLIAEKLLKPIL